MTSSNNAPLKLAARKVAKATYPVSFTGAGLSAESGVATFRDKSDDALWSKFDPTELASQAGFQSNPEMVIDWYNSRRASVAAAKPNAAHMTLAAQNNWVHVTQNVDHLLDSGCKEPNTVLHLHGTLYKDHCNNNCGHSQSVDLSTPSGLYNCPNCGALMRPSVVWFGESLSQEVLQAAVSAIQQADLLLVVGTSAMVRPAAGLIDLARENGADIIVVNTEKSTTLNSDDIELIGKAGELVPALFGV